MLGRFFWASVSDYLGRKRTYAIFFGAGFVLYLAIPAIAYRTSVTPGVSWLALFYVVTMLIFTMYGGGLPRFLPIWPIYSGRYVGAIHGRLLTAWSTAGVLGPWAITTLREHAVRGAIEKLAGLVSPTEFAAKFGSPLADLPLLLSARR